jgi:hypothetical protein
LLAFSGLFWQNVDGEKMNFKKPTIIEHLAFLSVKHDVYISELYEALVAAKENEKSVCGELDVEYRGKVAEQAIFLITKAGKVVVQFRVDLTFLLRKDICFENWMDTDKIRKQVARHNPEHHTMLIQNLRHGMNKVNIRAQVLELQKPQLVHTQYGNSVMLTNASIADETGKVKLCLWGDKINSVAVGDTVQITHASVRTFKGERQLSLGRVGTIEVMQGIAVASE